MSDAVYVGIRTHNSSKIMDETFQSVYNQTYPNLKLVVYDDHSTDDTVEKLNKSQEKFAGKGISVEVLSGSENLGCGKAFETLGRAVASRMRNNDTFVMIDSDDTFTSENAIANMMVQMKKTKANVLIAGFQLQGDMDLVLNWNSGTPHNNISHKLGGLNNSVTVEQMPEIASAADSIGWTKVVKGEIFKPYMQMFPNVKKEMSVCEDFPSLAMLLYKNAKITGLKDTPYNYFKHAGSVTVQARPEDFSVIRIGYLKTLQKIVKDNRDSFVPSAEQHVNAFLETKYAVISSIVDKKAQQGYLTGYTKQDFQHDFHRAIDCSDLKLGDEPPFAQTVKNKKGKTY